MASTKRPFEKNALCPVVGDKVTLSGILVELTGVPSQVARKNCSKIENCLAVYGSIERVPNCLLYSLRPQELL